MALRTNTVEYVFDTRTTALTSNTRNDFTSITLDIPENTDRKFLSVIVEVRCQNNDATGGNNISSRTIGIKLGAVAFDDQVRTEPLSEAFSTTSYNWSRDATAYFEANFGSGASQTCQVGFILNGQSTQTITAKLIITYQFEDAAQTTRVKTVRIPMESPTGLLSATLAEIGTNQVPNLTSTGLLPESSITAKSVWFEISANMNTGGDQTDFGVEASLDLEAGVSVTGTMEQGNTNFTRWFFAIWRRDDMTTTAAHAFKIRSTTANRVQNVCVDLVITYTYDHSASTRIINSLQMPMPRLGTRLGGSETSADASRSVLKLLVEEPGTVTLVQSAVRLTFNTWMTSVGNTLFRVGPQSFRTYTWGADFSSGAPNGWFTLQQRIDSGSAQSAGVTMARGEVSIVADAYMSDADAFQAPFNVDAMLTINYTSDKHALGANAHAHTTRWLLRDSIRSTGTTGLTSIAATKPWIPESHYWVSAIGAVLNVFIGGGAKVYLAAECGAGEGHGDGWPELADVVSYNEENTPFISTMDASALFSRHPLDPSTTRMNLSRTRRWRLGMSAQTSGLDSTDFTSDAQLFVTYSAMPMEVVRGVSPAQDGAEINVYRADNKLRLYKTNTLTTGAFSFICHTDALSHFAETVIGTSFAGRSFDFTPTGFSLNVAWLPTSLSGLAVWLRADLGVTTAGGSVSAWTDGSGSSNNAAQGTSGFRPTNPLDVGDGKAAILFDGTDDLLEVTDASSIGSPTSFSASLWVRTGATFPTDGTILAQWGATERFILKVAAGGNLQVSISAGTAATGTLTGVLAASTWYHIAFAYDGTLTGNANRLKIYINGVNQTISFSGTIPASTGNPTTILSIGSRNAASTYFNGHLDDIVFVDGRALTQDEVIAHYRYRPRFG